MNGEILHYVTSFFDIGRDSWGTFGRTFDEYLAEFLPLLNLFAEGSGKETKNKLYIYMDSAHFPRMQDILGGLGGPSNIKIISVDEEWMTKNTVWKILGREEKVMSSERFKDMVGGRIDLPECWNPKYTLVNHAKVDFMADVYNRYVEGDTAANYIAWVDFGFFKRDHLVAGPEKYVPRRFLDPRRFDPEKVNYTVINPLLLEDFDVEYTLKNAPEKVAGYFFILRADIMVKYQNLYHSALLEFNGMGYADDDQHLVLRCFEKAPEFFKFTKLPWHTALVHFQLGEEVPGEKKRLAELLGWDDVGGSYEKISLLRDPADIVRPAMLTFLTFNLTARQCEKIKGEFFNCKIYNIIYRNSIGCEKTDSLGIRSYDYWDEAGLRDLVSKEFKYINFDIKIIEKAVLKR